MLRDFNEVFQDELCDPGYAAGLLTVALNEEDFETFLVCLRDLVRARGGMTALAKTTGLGRESLYKTLSPNGNPEFKTILAILRALEISLDFAPTVKAAA